MPKRHDILFLEKLAFNALTPENALGLFYAYKQYIDVMVILVL